MKYRYKATRTFWLHYSKLSRHEKAVTQAAWKKFKEDPFYSSLRTHVIEKLSRAYGKTVYSVWILPDLRAIFLIDGNRIVTLDIGTHKIYR